MKDYVTVEVYAADGKLVNKYTGRYYGVNEYMNDFEYLQRIAQLEKQVAALEQKLAILEMPIEMYAARFLGNKN